MTKDAWGWMDPPGDPDVAGQGAEFVDLESNLPGAGGVHSHRRLVLRMPAAAEGTYARGETSERSRAS
jgi:hypothetical protein